MKGMGIHVKSGPFKTLPPNNRERDALAIEAAIRSGNINISNGKKLAICNNVYC